MKSRYDPVLTTPKVHTNVVNRSVNGYQRPNGTNVVMPTLVWKTRRGVE